MTENVLDNGEGLTVRRVLDDREVERGRRRGTGEKENQNLVFVLLGLMYYHFFFKIRFFFLIILTWKIVRISKVSVLYIYI